MGLMRSRGVFSFLGAVLSVTVVASTVRAEDDPEVLIREGVSLRRTGDDAKAYGYIKRAYEISHTPRTTAQLGLVEQALGRFLDSQQHLSEALDGNDAWVDQNRAVLEKSRESVRQHLGKIELQTASRRARWLEFRGNPRYRSRRMGCCGSRREW